ncbi:MAG: hypothetical protein JOZ92_06980 [Candidatus Dormibacteraeota bacterium]|nr:hypothetical protein [Candidatus Dormibacteraeota bacterium]
MRPVIRRVLTTIAAASTATAIAATPQIASAHDHDAFRVTLLVDGTTLRHAVGSHTEALSKPDDITYAGGRIFVAFQNGVGSQGEASTTGNLNSTIVELRRDGDVVRQWDITGKCDGLTADLGDHRLIATVNEDGSSSLYTVNLDTGDVDHYTYNIALPSNGGTDAITVYHDRIIVSASAPGTTGGPAAPDASYPAAYWLTLHHDTLVADVHSLFSDEATASVANENASNEGQPVQLGLVDPDSNAAVPEDSPRFAGSFEITSQGDLQQIFVRHLGQTDESLRVLNLSQSVDDTSWISDADDTLYATDSTNDRVVVVRGPFDRNEVLVNATPCDAGNAPAICPGPGFPPDYLAQLNLWTGQVTALEVKGLDLQPSGLLVVSDDSSR